MGEPPPTPLPPYQLLSCMLVMMTVAFQINVIWPFLPFMVDTIRGTDENAGFYVGLLASAYFWAQFAAAFAWGAMPARFGCRHCMIFSSIAVGVSLVGFGMSESFEAAVFWRVVGGLLNGNMPVVKSYLARITDKSNQAKGFSVLSFSWGLGGLVAPTVGGFLSEPALKYPGLQLEGGPFARWPYLLPCVAAGLVCFAAAASAAVWIPDDAPRRASQQYARVQASDDATDRPGRAGAGGSGELARPAAAAEKEVGGGSLYAAGAEEEEEDGERITSPGYLELLSPEMSGLACLAYLWSSLNYVIFDEMLPLYCKADYDHGGLQWDTNDIGTALSVGGLVLCFYQPLVYPKLTNRFGVVGTYRIGIWTFSIATGAFSFMTYLVPYGPAAVWASMAVFRALYVHAATCCFAGAGLLINNSCELRDVAKVNGIGQAIASLARAVFPTVAGERQTT